MAAKNLRQFEFRLGKLGPGLLLGGLAILVFIGFLFGVQVGMHIDTYPGWIARGFPAWLVESLGPSMTPVRSDVPVGKPGVDLFDVKPPQPDKAGEGGIDAEGTQATAAVPEAASATLGADVQAPAGTKHPATEAGQPSPPQTTVKKESAQRPKTAVREQEDVKAPAAEGQFYVQVVSFREKEKADSLGKRIQTLGYRPRITPTEIPGKGQWHRVTIEGFETKQAAQMAASDVSTRIKGLNCVIMAK
jgi:cell division septation protein DedD